MYLLHLDLKAIVTIVKSMDIEHMNADHRQNPIGLIKGRTMHITMYLLNVTSLDIQANTVGLKYQQKITTPRVKANWTLIKTKRRIKKGRKR